MNSFHYRPLEKSKNDIRLLKVRPSANLEAEIICDLEHATLHDGLDYHALSYTWGDQSSRRSIKVEDQTIPVTRNLHSALQTFRQTDAVYTIWVDAVCINQADVIEKSHQITLMRDIYHHASEVTIWLGEAEDNSGEDNNDLAFDALEQICRWTPDDRFYFGVLSLAKVLERPWWKRVWTLQEVVVAKNPVVYCGSRSTPWDRFVKLRQVLRERASTNAARVAFNDVRNELLQYLQKSDFIYATDTTAAYRTIGRTPLGDLLLVSASRQATEPRDHVYGLLGLASDADTIHPEYTKSVQSVFTEALNIVVGSYPSYLDFLQHGALLQRQGNMPSWYIDFAGGRKSSTIGAFLQGCATGDLSASKFSDDGLKLTIAGWRVGQVVFESRYVRDDPGAAHDLSNPCPPPALHEWLRYIQNNPACIDRYGDASSLLAGFYLSLTAGTDLSSGTTSYTGLGRTPKTSWHYVSAAVKASADAWFAATDLRNRGSSAPNDSQSKEEWLTNFKASKLFRHCALQHLRERAFIVTKEGFIGIGPTEVREGDIMALIWGAGTPICLRPSATKLGKFEWIGAAWIAGIMQGELYEAKIEGQSKVDIFDVV